MKRHRNIGRAAAVVLALLAAAMPAPAADIEERLWYADNGQQHAWVAGGRLEFERPLATNRLGFAGLDLEYGRYDNNGDTETHGRYAAALGAELAHGWRAGAGFEYRDIRTRLKEGWIWDTDHPEERERNADIYGPMLYAAWEGFVRNPNAGWKLEFSWMFYDMGELTDIGYDGANVRMAASAFYRFRQLVLRTGYRLEEFRDMPDRVSNDERSSRDTIQGPFFSLGVSF
ncbi:MAG: hypothetical protein KA248_13555 [Kiritimatiellae bacterium]|nr:hypothetical protein [Kiritimatiellia bacterium]